MATGRVQREQLASHDHGAVLKRALVQVPGDVRDVQDAEVQDGHVQHEHADVQLQLLSAAAVAAAMPCRCACSAAESLPFSFGRACKTAREKGSLSDKPDSNPPIFTS